MSDDLFRVARRHCQRHYRRNVVKLIFVLDDDEQVTEQCPPCSGRDFRSVLWLGKRYSFTRTQAAIVKLLWDAWEDGTDEVSQEFLLEAVDSQSARLRDIFKGSDAWWEMIVPGDGSGGTFRLHWPGGAA